MIEFPIEKLPAIIFLVAQNFDRLYGVYFVKGVVIAQFPQQAVDKIETQVKEWGEEMGNTVLFDRSKITVFELGTLLRRPDGGGLGVNQRFLSTEDVLGIDFGDDNI